MIQISSTKLSRSIPRARCAVAGIGPGHRSGQDDVLHAPPPVRRDRGVPRAMGHLLGVHGLHGRRELASWNGGSGGAWFLSRKDGLSVPVAIGMPV